MAGEKPLTPEKELLNLIEKPVQRGSLRTASIRYQGMSLFSWGALQGRFAFLKNRFKFGAGAGGLRQPDIRSVNLVLEIAFVVLVAYLAVSVTVSALRLRKDIKLKIAVEKAPEGAEYPIASFLKATSYYLEKARERDIFRMGGKAPASGSSLASRGPSQRVLEATQNLKLVGISWSDDPDVMIEDTKTQRTFFLKMGQMIDNTIKIEAVFKDRVILTCEGEQITLR